MANNISVTEGTGKTIATDQGSDGNQYQKIKLIDPTAGSIDGIGTLANPMYTRGTYAISNFPSNQLVTLSSDPDVTVVNFPGSYPVTGTFWQDIQPISGTINVGNFPASQPVTGTFWQATQPVSLATMPTTPVTGTFWQATQPVSIASMPTTPVTGTFWQATQPVSGSVSVSNFPATQAVTGTFFQATQPVSILPASLSVTATGAAAAAVTATLPAVSGQFHYITGIEIEAFSSAARTGSATPVIVTSTNLPGSNAWTFASAAAIGTADTKWYQTANPIRSSVVNTATTIVCPATTGIIWRVNVYYYTAV